MFPFSSIAFLHLFAKKSVYTFMLKDVFLSWFPEKGGRLVNYNSGSNQGE